MIYLLRKNGDKYELCPETGQPDRASRKVEEKNFHKDGRKYNALADLLKALPFKMPDETSHDSLMILYDSLISPTEKKEIEVYLEQLNGGMQNDKFSGNRKKMARQMEKNSSVRGFA